MGSKHVEMLLFRCKKNIKIVKHSIYILFLFIVGHIHGQNSDFEISIRGKSFNLMYGTITEETEPAAILIQASEIFEEITRDLNELFDLPQTINIRFGAGLDGPSYFQQNIDMPYEFLLTVDHYLANAGYSQSDEEQAEALLNITEFVLYHEVGHALIDVLDIPVLGKDEDAVDGFAAILATQWDLDEVALATADLHSIQAEQAGGDISDEEFWDSHSLDEQRMFSILCMIYGSDSNEHASLLEEIGMPDEKGAECEYEYHRAKRNWERVLGNAIKGN